MGLWRTVSDATQRTTYEWVPRPHWWEYVLHWLRNEVFRQHG